MIGESLGQGSLSGAAEASETPFGAGAGAWVMFAQGRTAGLSVLGRSFSPGVLAFFRPSYPLLG